MKSNRRDLERQKVPFDSSRSENDSFFRRTCEFVVDPDGIEDHSRQEPVDYDKTSSPGQHRLVHYKEIGVTLRKRYEWRSLMHRDNPLVGIWEHVKDHPEFKSYRGDTNLRLAWAFKAMSYLQRCS